MKQEVECQAPNCKNRFIQYKSNHKYCSRKCFKIGYKIEQEQNIYRCPIYTCFNCGGKTEIDFDPRAEYQKWCDFKCQECGVGRINDPDFKNTEEIKNNTPKYATLVKKVRVTKPWG